MRVASCLLNGRDCHAVGRQLLERLCLAETGEPMPEIYVTPRGKPYFPGSPLHFSISHTNRHVFCVLAHCPVGIDVEETDRTVLPSLVRRVLSPSEYTHYVSAPDPNRAFLALWTLKEASVKLSGEGLQGFPNHTDFSPEDPRLHLWHDCIVALVAQDPHEGVTYHAF